MRRAHHFALLALFLVAIYGPLLGSLLASDSGELLRQERRALARRPALEDSLESLAAFPTAFEAWYRDRFGGRGTLIRLHGLIKFRLLRAGSRSVFVGRNGWLYLWDSTHGALEQHQGLSPLRPEVLAAWVHHLEERSRHYAERGIAYVFAVAPGKPTVHPEHLPDWLNASVAETPLDQLLAALEARGTVPVLDLRPVLAEARERGAVFYRTDTHWNDAGAFAASRAIASRLARSGVTLAPLSERDLVRREDAGFTGDLARMLHLAGDLREEAVHLVPRTGLRAESLAPEDCVPERLLDDFHRLHVFETGREGPTAVISGDSFLGALQPFLAARFGRTYHAVRSRLGGEFLDWAEPDLVVEEVAERFIWHPPESQWLPRAAAVAAAPAPR